MKIKIKVKQDFTGQEFEEFYTIDNDMNPNVYAQNMINHFNNTLYPNESPRTLIEVLIIDKEESNNIKHIWEKQNLITIKGKLGSYDNMKCKVCGITGRRYGLSEVVTRDNKYKDSKFQYCNWKIK